MKQFLLSNVGLLLLGLLVVSLAFLSLWERNRMIQTGYAIEQVKQELKQLRRMHQTLLAEKESLSSLARIEQIAEKRLGMVRTRERDYRLLEEQYAQSPQ